MPSTLWSANRIISILLYISVIILTSWGGIHAINYSIDSKFYKDFLIKWEISIRLLNQIQAAWPVFSGNNHVQYMEQLTLHMKNNQIAMPASNTQFPYIYIMDKIGSGHGEHKIFVLCLPDKLILYDISKESLERIDRFVDGIIRSDQGRFQWQPNKGNSLYTCVWKL